MVEAMNCGNCKKGFDLKARLPWLLMCGHSVCQLCTGKNDEGVNCSECSTLSGKALTYDHYRIGVLFTNGHFPISVKGHKSLIDNTLFCSEHPKSVVHYVDDEDSSLLCADCVQDNDLDLDERHISPIEEANKSKFSELDEIVDSIKTYKKNIASKSKVKKPDFLTTINGEFFAAHSTLQVKRVKTLLMMMDQNPAMSVFNEILASNDFMQSSGGLPESGLASKLINMAKHTLPSDESEEATSKNAPKEPPFVSIQISDPQVNVNHNFHNYYFEEPSDKYNNSSSLKAGDQVKVVHVNSPSSFFVRRIKDGSSYESISNLIASSIAPGGLTFVKEGNMYALHEDDQWCRVVILNHRSDMPQVRVSFVDTGKVKFVPVDGLRCFVDTKKMASVNHLVNHIALSNSKNCRFQKDQLEQFKILSRPNSPFTFWIDRIEGDDSDEFDLLFIGENGSLNSLRDVCIQEKIISFKPNVMTDEVRHMPRKRIHWNEIVTPDLSIKSTDPNKELPRLKKEQRSNSKGKLNKEFKKRPQKKKKNTTESDRPSSVNSNASNNNGNFFTFQI